MRGHRGRPPPDEIRKGITMSTTRTTNQNHRGTIRVTVLPNWATALLRQGMTWTALHRLAGNGAFPVTRTDHITAAEVGAVVRVGNRAGFPDRSEAAARDAATAEAVAIRFYPEGNAAKAKAEREATEAREADAASETDTAPSNTVDRGEAYTESTSAWVGDLG